MYAKYIKQEIADLNGTGHTQAYYKMKTQTMSHDEFVDLWMLLLTRPVLGRTGLIVGKDTNKRAKKQINWDLF